ncbi:MAG: hypothetical protein JW738_04245 [Actinobacteria bacterium]|nr:hypothetical protein [Actinomycetota bacterium]
MAGEKVCKECGVPKLIYKGLTWQNTGIIFETKDPEHRMFFAESENLEELFAEIENLIGTSIDKFVIEAKSRLTKEYLQNMIPAFVLKLLYMVKPTLIVKRMAAIAKAYGYGKVEFVDIKAHKKEGDYLAMTIEHPYSIRFYQGDNLGGMEAGTGKECTTAVKETEDDKYLLEMWIGTHPPELKEHLRPTTYPITPGNVELERCPSCGVPLAVAEYNFDMDTGIISHPESGTRMAFYGPVGPDSVFLSLEQELGLSIAETIIEAQKRYWKRIPTARSWAVGEESLRQMLAIRGYGILTGFESDSDHYAVTIQNASAVYLMVGMTKGLFESVRNVDSSSHEWSVSEDGELSITIRSND